jgi:hypothetical protein
VNNSTTQASGNLVEINGDTNQTALDVSGNVSIDGEINMNGKGILNCPEIKSSGTLSLESQQSLVIKSDMKVEGGTVNIGKFVISSTDVPIMAMTSNTELFAQVTSDYEANSQYAIHKAFDKDFSTEYITDAKWDATTGVFTGSTVTTYNGGSFAGSFINLKLPQSVTVESFSFRENQSQSRVENSSWRKISVLGRNGSLFNVIGTIDRTGALPTPNTVTLHTFAAPVTYNEFRWVFLEKNCEGTLPNNRINVRDLWLNEAPTEVPTDVNIVGDVSITGNVKMTGFSHLYKSYFPSICSPVCSIFRRTFGGSTQSNSTTPYNLAQTDQTGGTTGTNIVPGGFLRKGSCIRKEVTLIYTDDEKKSDCDLDLYCNGQPLGARYKIEDVRQNGGYATMSVEILFNTSTRINITGKLKFNQDDNWEKTRTWVVNNDPFATQDWFANDNLFELWLTFSKNTKNTVRVITYRTDISR